MQMQATQLRVGNIIEHEGQLWRVMQATHRTPGNKRGFMQVKLRNLRAGTQTEYRFASEDRVERVSLEQHVAEYLFESGGRYTFMNTDNYEQIELDRDALGDAVNYLVPNNQIEIEFHDGTPIGVSLPKTVDLKVVEAAPGIKTATVSNVLKPAKTETGLVVGVPNFINEGDVVTVDTESGEYVGRAKG
ncbi:MAG TPA: elongation factor P [Candidatus Eisenbacteria bacterium]|nr:elongation factor P [Candidatus Eisenbacteria bacterium]